MKHINYDCNICGTHDLEEDFVYGFGVLWDKGIYKLIIAHDRENAFTSCKKHICFNCVNIIKRETK